MVDLKNRVSNSIKNSTIGLIAQLIQSISTFACRMIFVRVLSTEFYGINGLFSNVLGILSIAELGIGTAISFELYGALAKGDEDEQASLLQFYKKAYCIIGLFIAVIGLIMLPFIQMLVKSSDAVSDKIYIYYLLYLSESVISYFYSYKQTIVSVAQQNYVLTIIEVACGILRNIIQCFVLILTKNFVLYLIVQVLFKVIYNHVSSHVSGILFPVVNRKEPQKLNPEIKQRMYNNVKYVFITNVLSKIMGSMDNIIITALDGLALTGINSNYTLIMATVNTFTMRIQAGITAGIGNVSAVESNKKKLEVFYEVFLVYFWLFFWCSVCFALLVQDTVYVFFGKDYVLPMSIGIVTGLDFMIFHISQCRRTFHNTMGLFKYGKYISAIQNLINVVLSVVLGKQLGLFGVLLATVIARVSVDWFGAWQTFKYGFEQSVLPYYRRVVSSWGVAIVIFIITWWICALPDFSMGIVNIMYKAVVCVIVPNVLFVLTQARKPEFKRLSKKMKRYFNGIFSKSKKMK